MSNLLTNSRLKCNRQCQRLHHLKYDLGYRPTEDVHALRFGTLVHAGLEAWWLAIKAKLEQGEWLEAALAAVQGEADVWDRIRAEEVLRGYHFRWQDEPYEVLAVEVQFDTELRNPETGRPSQTWRLGGKVDGVVRDLRDLRVLALEHKTASGDIGPGSEYWRRLRIDGQVSLYYEGTRSLGHDVEGCLYDVLGKPGQKPLLATPEESRKYTKAGALYANQRLEDETPGAFRLRVREAIAEDPAAHYQRGEVARLDGEVEEALHDVWQQGRQIRESQLAQRYPRNPDACASWGRTCSFFDVCTGAASLDDTSRFTRSSNVHPELEPKEEATQP